MTTSSSWKQKKKRINDLLVPACVNICPLPPCLMGGVRTNTHTGAREGPHTVEGGQRSAGKCRLCERVIRDARLTFRRPRFFSLGFSSPPRSCTESWEKTFMKAKRCSFSISLFLLIFKSSNLL